MSFLLLTIIVCIVFFFKYYPSYNSQIKMSPTLINPSVLDVVYKVPNRFKMQKNTLSGLIATCNPKDYSCKIYNHRDALSKCSKLCDKKFPDSIFTGNYLKTKELNSCECKMIENLTNTEADTNENSDKLIYHKLVFGK